MLPKPLRQRKHYYKQQHAKDHQFYPKHTYPPSALKIVYSYILAKQQKLWKGTLPKFHIILKKGPYYNLIPFGQVVIRAWQYMVLFK